MTSTPPSRRSRTRGAERASTSSSRRARSTWSTSSGSSRRRSSSRHDIAVSYVAGRVDEVEFCCEDATRSDPAFVAEVCRAAIEAGRRRSISPTPSATRFPDEHAAFLLEVRRLCPELADVTLSVHCHDDLGLAVANTLAGIRSGCDAGRVHGQRPRRARGQRCARGGRDGAPRARRTRSVTRPASTSREIGAHVAARLAAHGVRASSATRRSSARARSRTRPASTRTGCSRTQRPTRSWTRRSWASR